MVKSNKRINKNKKISAVLFGLLFIVLIGASFAFFNKTIPISENVDLVNSSNDESSSEVKKEEVLSIPKEIPEESEKPKNEVSEPEKNESSESENPGNYIDNGKPKIAFTFDDGPWHTTDRLLDLLEKYDSKATFFIVGKHSEKRKDVLNRIASLGMEFGNHSYNHTKLTDDNIDDFLKEIDDTNDVIKEACGKPSKTIRLPGGAFDYEKELLEKLPYPIMNWSIDTKDWKSKDKDAIVKAINDEVFDGAVILVHDIYSTTIDAMDEIIPSLIEEGYELVTLEELALSRGIELENGKIYRDFS